MDFSKMHPVHGALAGVLVYAVTGKPLPALAVGGGAYLYMSVYGHALPGSTPAPDLKNVSTFEVPLLPVGAISHDPAHPTILAMG